MCSFVCFANNLHFSRDENEINVRYVEIYRRQYGTPYKFIIDTGRAKISQLCLLPLLLEILFSFFVLFLFFVVVVVVIHRQMIFSPASITKPIRRHKITWFCICKFIVFFSLATGVFIVVIATLNTIFIILIVPFYQFSLFYYSSSPVYS